MVTYLLASGYSSFQVAIARTISVIFEISATWLAPLVMSRTGALRPGPRFTSWQMLCLGGGVAVFWTFQSPAIAASGLVIGTMLSRIGLWGFDLSSQMIVQDEVEADHRGSFSSIEASLQNGFELLSYVSTI
jgi:solute carrier family 40 (iron-regulated transporter), member 1